ncbi:MAG: flagellar filament capping protein FliD, partial [Actinomycetota bacterium]
SFIDGIASGLDTSSIINQLMAIERRPQVALTTQRDQHQAAKEELSGLRSDLNALRDTAADLRLSSGWDVLAATSSDPEAVSVTATTASTTGSYSFQVTGIASAASEYTDVYATTDTVVNGTDTLAEVAAAVNADGDLGLSAVVVDVGNGFRLQLTADETGADSSVDTANALFAGMNFTTLSSGTDAELTVQGENPFTVTSSTNTFEALLPGVTVTVNAVTTTPVTVSTERDVEALSEKVSGFVTSLNEFLTRVETSTVNRPNAERSVLQGNREARKAADELRQAFAAGMDTNDFTSVGVVGIELTRQGQFEFNANEFADALATDPAMLAGLFADRTGDENAELGALDRIVEVAEAAASVGDGYLYTATESADRIIEDYNRQIDSYERRLELRESTLRRTYANLEVALGGLQSQSNWLAGQLNSLGGTNQ